LEHGVWTDAGDVLNDEEGLATMDSLAENMLWLLEKSSEKRAKK
jgi:hypothetical protein